MPVLILLLLFCSGLPVAAAVETFHLQPYQRGLSLTGFTRPIDEFTLSTEVGGRCLAVHVDIGQAVPPSGLVAELDGTFLRLDLESNRIAQQQAARQLELEKKTAARFATLMDSRSTAEATYEEAVLQADIFELTLQNLKNQEVRLREQLDRHRLSGPVGWKVIERYAQPGEYLQPGAPLLRLGDFRRMLVPLLLTHAELALFTEASALPLFFPETGASLDGKIHRIAPVVDEKSRKIPVELVADIPGPGDREEWRGGLRVQIHLPGRNEPGVFVAPRGGLLSQYDAHWLITASGERLPVQLLDGRGNQVLVSGEGLSAEIPLRFPASPGSSPDPSSSGR
jgi:RND family efflux transporter MFP subunit